MRWLALLLGLLLTQPAEAASTINNLPPVTSAPGQFPFPDPGCTATSTENFWVSQGTGPQADFKVDVLRGGYIFQGPNPPSCPFRYQLWWDTNATPPTLSVYSGSQWVQVAWFDVPNNAWIQAVGGGSIPTITSSPTTDLCQGGTMPNPTVNVSGNATITSFGSSCVPGSRKIVVWKGTPKIVNSPSIILPGGAPTTVNNGDVWFVNYLGGGVWQEYFQQPGEKTFGLTIGLSGGLPNASKTIELKADVVNVGTSLSGATSVLTNFDQTFNAAATGAGGMDTGTAPLNNFLAIYAINGQNGASTLGVTCDLSCPTIYVGTHMPTGYNASALLAVWPTDGGGNLVAGYWKGKRFQWGPVGAPLYADQTPETSPTALSLLGFVPVVATTVQGQMSIVVDSSYVGGSPYMIVQSDGNALAGTYTVQGVIPASTSGAVNNNFDLNIVTPKTIWYETSSDISQHCAAYLWVYSYTIP